MVSSEVEKKRLLIKLVLCSFGVAGENLHCEAKKPFNLLLNGSDGLVWSQTLGTLPTSLQLRRTGRTLRWSKLREMLNLPVMPVV